MEGDAQQEATGPVDPRGRYERAAADGERVTAALVGRMRRVEVWRLATFVVGAILYLLRVELPGPAVVYSGVAFGALVAFVLLVRRHRELRAAHRRAEVELHLARWGLARLDRDWDRLTALRASIGYADPLFEAGALDRDHPYAFDLDVFGPASVRALMGPTPTPEGVRTLGAWLSRPASPPEVARRRSMVASLAEDVKGRAHLTTEGLLVQRIDEAGWREFLGWLEADPVFRSGEGPGAVLPPWSRYAALIGPPVVLVLVGAWAAGLVPWVVWAAPLLLQTVWAWRWGQDLSDYFHAAASTSGALHGHHALFEAWESYATSEPEVRALQQRLAGDSGTTASAELRRLERWLDAADSRASSLHAVFQAVLLWDVHVVSGLERWRARAGSHVADWFVALGELEAVEAMATVVHDHPNWCWPSLDGGSGGFGAEGLGHPLLPEEVLRTTDVTLDPPGRFLLVTGSNMSGKSTLLRSVGLAAVLAQAGCVVCARTCRMSSLRPFTSMRVQDSLTGGVSLFMAELLRLKALVDAAHTDGDRPALLYLIDEVLQGTNSEERRIAARSIVKTLLGTHAIGAVTTHDLSLHEDPRLEATATKVHFTEEVGADQTAALTFDYVLRPGLATSRNALRLLRLVGLDQEA